MQKIGYFRISQESKEEYVSYDEYYSMWSENLKNYYRQLQDTGKIKMSCACQDNDELELSITKNLVIRVKNNKQQLKHKESCPKSETYGNWLAQNRSGAFLNEDGILCFNITVPTGNETQYNSGSSSGESTSSDGAGATRANALDMATYIIAYAWQKQTYSIKKQISMARKEGKKPEWSYKSQEEFMKLFYGVTNEINVYREKSIFPFSSMCFKTSTFYAADYKQKFFLYAKVIDLGEFQKDWKYQTITIAAPYNSEKRLKVRILTDTYTKMTTDLDMQEDENCYVAGYVRHDSFHNKDGSESSWITMLKGIFLFTSQNGYYITNRKTPEKEVIDILSTKHILFHRPLMPLDNYGGYVPTMVIEQLKGKDIVIDICATLQEKTKKEKFAEKNTSYDFMLYSKKDTAQDIVDALFDKFKENKGEN